MKTQPVRKAVIAAAGYGTRFLPQTKAMPKEMLPIIDKPIIQYIVEELVDAGIKDIVIVTGYHKRSVEDHFDSLSADLRANLTQAGKLELLEKTSTISELANFAYIRQKGVYGNGTPLLNAEHMLGQEPFIYTFADDFIVAKPSRFKQMVEVYNQHGCGVLPCISIHNEEDFNRYGVVAGDAIEDGLLDMRTIVEKPGKQNAPSDLATVSAYLLTSDIFPYLHQALDNLPEGDEFYVQAGMQRMIDDGKRLLAYKIKNGKFYDTGNKLEYIKTMVDFALRHEDIQDDFRAYLERIIS